MLLETLADQISSSNLENKKHFEKVIFLGETNECTVKPVYNGHPWDPKIEAVVDRWPLFRGSLYYKN